MPGGRAWGFWFGLGGTALFGWDELNGLLAGDRVNVIPLCRERD